MFIFGGYSRYHQISKVENCRLTSIGQLNFSMKKGACTNVGNELVFICFYNVYDSSTDKKCWKASEPLATFQAARDSSYTHRETRVGNDGGTVLSIIEIHFSSEKILAVGSYEPYNVKAEWLDVTRNVWESLPDYPFGMSFICSHEKIKNLFLNAHKNSVKPVLHISITAPLFIKMVFSFYLEDTLHLFHLLLQCWMFLQKLGPKLAH